MAQNTRSGLHFNIYILSLLLIAGSIPLSPFLLTVSMFLLGLNWLAEGGFRKKFTILRQSPTLIVFSLVYLVHLVWMVNTSEMGWGMYDLKKKLPLLLFPLIIATSRPLTLDQVKYVLLLFILAVTSSTIISSVVFVVSQKAFFNIREISLFVSYIRFSIMLVFSAGILIYFIFSDNISKTKGEKLFYMVLVVWLSLFVFVLRSMTGILIMVILFVPILLWIKNQMKDARYNIYIYTFSLAFILYLLFIIIYPVKLYNRDYKPNFEELEQYTVNGNPYVHYMSNKDRENGHYIWYYISEHELQKEWNRISNLDYFGHDHKGHLIRYTLIRYLTSKGLHKDSAGIAQFSQQDIRLVESGVANYIYGRKFGIYPRVYEMLWEVDNYRKGMNPSGHSLLQRMEFLKAAFKIIGDNFWFGTGTGDLRKEFREQYIKINSQLAPEARLRAHNQFVSFFIAFGLTGFIICLAGFILPIVAHRHKLFLVSKIFLTVLFLSMLNEDTLETHIGVSLFAFFYSIFLFSYDGSKTTVTLHETFKRFVPFKKIHLRF